MKIEVIFADHFGLMLQPMQLEFFPVHAQKTVPRIFYKKADATKVLECIKPLLLIPKAAEETLRD
jgi:hypothetical protein